MWHFLLPKLPSLPGTAAGPIWPHEFPFYDNRRGSVATAWGNEAAGFYFQQILGTLFDFSFAFGAARWWSLRTERNESQMWREGPEGWRVERGKWFAHEIWPQSWWPPDGIEMGLCWQHMDRVGVLFETWMTYLGDLWMKRMFWNNLQVGDLVMAIMLAIIVYEFFILHEFLDPIFEIFTLEGTPEY